MVARSPRGIALSDRLVLADVRSQDGERGMEHLGSTPKCPFTLGCSHGVASLRGEVASGLLLLVALDHVGRAGHRGVGIPSGVAARAPLAQEIPALVE